MAIAQATGAELTLLSIEPDLPTIVPGFDWRQVRRQTETMLADARDSLAPGARTMIDSDRQAGAPAAARTDVCARGRRAWIVQPAAVGARDPSASMADPGSRGARDGG